GAFSRSVPEWYEPPAADDEQVAALADRVEYRLLEEAQKIRPAEEHWTLRVREEQVNAWLSSRLPDWIAHERNVRWPDRLGTPQVRFAEDEIAVALPVGEGPYRRVFVARLAPAVRDGALIVELIGLQVGRLAIPGDPLSTMASMLRQASLDGTIDVGSWQPVLDVLSGREPIDPVLTLSDDRRVELLGVTCRTAAIELTSRTHGIRPADPRWTGSGPEPGPGTGADLTR
ncbi:MAG: hypothetical protein ACYTJ0_08830, partial [Planctomycetota bacterium]